jgi:gliding motility-associated lipoprotein GldH
MKAGDTTTLYQMNIEIDHAEKYAFSNLYVRVTTTYPSGKEVVSITSLEMADKDGTWSGDCHSGTCHLELTLQSRFTFPETGTYTWAIGPYMRVDTIAGIERLKVSCSKMKPLTK